MTSLYFYSTIPIYRDSNNSLAQGTSFIFGLTTLVPIAEAIVRDMHNAQEVAMRVRRNISLFLGLALFVALTALPAFDGWSMGSRVPTVGMQAEDFQL